MGTDKYDGSPQKMSGDLKRLLRAHTICSNALSSFFDHIITERSLNEFMYAAIIIFFSTRSTAQGKTKVHNVHNALEKGERLKTTKRYTCKKPMSEMKVFYQEVRELRNGYIAHSNSKNKLESQIVPKVTATDEGDRGSAKFTDLKIPEGIAGTQNGEWAMVIHQLSIAYISPERATNIKELFRAAIEMQWQEEGLPITHTDFDPKDGHICQGEHSRCAIIEAYPYNGDKIRNWCNGKRTFYTDP